MAEMTLSLNYKMQASFLVDLTSRERLRQDSSLKWEWKSFQCKASGSSHC